MLSQIKQISYKRLSIFSVQILSQIKSLRLKTQPNKKYLRLCVFQPKKSVLHIKLILDLLFKTQKNYRNLQKIKINEDCRPGAMEQKGAF